MQVLKGIGIFVCAAILITALFIGGRELGWWLKTDNTKRQVELDVHNKGTQTAWHDEASKNIDSYYTVPEGSPAQANLRRSACDLISRLDDPYRDDKIVTFEAQEC